MLNEVSNGCLVSSLADDFHPLFLPCSSVFYPSYYELFLGSSFSTSLFRIDRISFYRFHHHLASETVLNQFIDSRRRSVYFIEINDLHTSLFHGRIDFSNLTMHNNATTISSLFISTLPAKLPNATDFLVINLSDGNLNKQDLVRLDQQFDQNLTIQSDFGNTTLDAVSNSTTSFNQTGNQEPVIAIHHPLLALFLACICIFIVLGNLLIIVAVRKSRQLRQQTTNYFVISLAFSDALVGLIVMPFSVVQEVMNKVWIFGPGMCDLWHSFDVWGTTSSILSLCVISIDRYYAITKPFDYAVKMTSKKAKLLIVLIFVVSSLLSFPAIFWWRSVSVYKPYECTFPVSTGYIIFSSTLSFYGPLVVMVVAYYRIYRAAVEQTRSLKTGAKTISYTSNIYHAGSGTNNLGHFDNGQFNTKTGSTGDYIPDHMITLRMHRGGNYNDSISSKYNSNLKIDSNKKAQKHQKKKPFSLASASSKGRSSTSLDRLASVFCNIRTEKDENMTSGSKVDLNSNNENDNKPDECEDEMKQNSFEQSQGITSGGKQQVNNAWSISRKVSKLAKERKAAKTLGIVMGVFIFCWMPFFLTHIVMGICASNCDINEDAVYSFVTWLGWLNSGMNPLIYACWSRDFRKAFRKVLCGFRDSQRSSTGYSSYYFSSKFRAPASSLARKRPLIGDRHFNYTNRHPNRLTSLKQSNQLSNQAQQLKLDNRGRIIETINELDDSRAASKAIRNLSKPTESRSSPNLSLSNVIKESDSNGLKKSPLELGSDHDAPTNQQSNLMSIERQTTSLDQPISEKQFERNDSNSQSNNLNNQTTLSNFKEKQATKTTINSDGRRTSNVLNGQSNRKENKFDTEKNDKIRRMTKIKESSTARFSLGNWFRSKKDRKKDKKMDKKQTDNRQRNKTNDDSPFESVEDDGYETNRIVSGHVDKVMYNNDDAKFEQNNNRRIVETNQAEDNNLSSIGQNLETVSGSKQKFSSAERTEQSSDYCNQVIEQNRIEERIEEHARSNQDGQQENVAENKENIVDQDFEQSNQSLVAHSRVGEHELINGNKNGRLTSPYHCTYKITAEQCTKSPIDETSVEQNDLEEEFTIKIQFS